MLPLTVAAEGRPARETVPKRGITRAKSQSAVGGRHRLHRLLSSSPTLPASCTVSLVRFGLTVTSNFDVSGRFSVL